MKTEKDEDDDDEEEKDDESIEKNTKAKNSDCSCGKIPAYFGWNGRCDRSRILYSFMTLCIDTVRTNLRIPNRRRWDFPPVPGFLPL